MSSRVRRFTTLLRPRVTRARTTSRVRPLYRAARRFIRARPRSALVTRYKRAATACVARRELNRSIYEYIRSYDGKAISVQVAPKVNRVIVVKYRMEGRAFALTDYANFYIKDFAGMRRYSADAIETAIIVGTGSDMTAATVLDAIKHPQLPVATTIGGDSIM